MFLRMRLQPSQSRSELVTSATSNNNDNNKFGPGCGNVGRDVDNKAQGTKVCMYMSVCMCARVSRCIERQQTNVQGDRWRTWGMLCEQVAEAVSSSVASKYVCSW